MEATMYGADSNWISDILHYISKMSVHNF